MGAIIGEGKDEEEGKRFCYCVKWSKASSVFGLSEINVSELENNRSNGRWILKYRRKKETVTVHYLIVSQKF